MSYFGLHLQTPVPEWDSEILWAAEQGKPYPVFKSLFVEACKIVKQLSPTTVTVFRQHIEHQQPFLDRAAISPQEADYAADDFIATFQDSVNYHGGIDYVESLNETYASGNLLNQQKAVAFDRAFIRRLKVHCPYVKPVVYTAASGNIDHGEWSILLPLAQDCAIVDGAFGYHNYWSVFYLKSFVNFTQVALDYHMRWAWSLDAYLVAHGVRVNYILGESGPIGSGPDGYWQLPEDGWKASNCWAGDIQGYLGDLMDMDDLLDATVAAQEGRLIGATLFTSGIGTGWEQFQIQQPMLGHLTDHVINYETTPPNPPPTNGFEAAAWNLTVEMQETGQNGIRLNALAGIQQKITEENFLYPDYQLQVVTAETMLDGKVIQAIESLTGETPRRVYVYEPGKPVYYFEEP